MPRVGPGPEGLIDASLPISELPGVSPPYGEVLLFRQKDPKPWTPRLALLEGRDANRRRAAQLARLTQGPPNAKSVPPWGPAGRRRTIEDEPLRYTMNEEGERNDGVEK